MHSIDSTTIFRIWHDLVISYELNPYEARILGEIFALCEGEEQVCFLSGESYIKRCKIGRNVVRNSLRKLKELKIIEDIDRAGKSTLYKLCSKHIPPLHDQAPLHNQVPLHNETPLHDQAGVGGPDQVIPLHDKTPPRPDKVIPLPDQVPESNNNNNNLSLSSKKKKGVITTEKKYTDVIYELTGGKFHKAKIDMMFQYDWAKYDPDNIVIPAIKSCIKRKEGMKDINSLNFFTKEITKLYSEGNRFVTNSVEEIKESQEDHEPNEIMRIVKRDLKKQIGEASYRSWFQNKVFCLEYDQSRGIVQLGFHSKFTQNWIMKTYKNQLEKCCSRNFSGYNSIETSVISKQQRDEFMFEPIEQFAQKKNGIEGKSENNGG